MIVQFVTAKGMLESVGQMTAGENVCFEVLK